jgi:O-phospho-L-seryl-tRNASec:L-selenocysteinyl-tRNA synthase
MGHGIGRSGYLTEIQPKAVGSSMMQQLTTSMVRHALILSGAKKEWVRGCLILPLATGMTLTMVLLTLKIKQHEGSKYVILPRIDQKTCVKCIYAAGICVSRNE